VRARVSPVSARRVQYDVKGLEILECGFRYKYPTQSVERSHTGCTSLDTADRTILYMVSPPVSTRPSRSGRHADPRVRACTRYGQWSGHQKQTFLHVFKLNPFSSYRVGRSTGANVVNATALRPLACSVSWPRVAKRAVRRHTSTTCSPHVSRRPPLDLSTNELFNT
jgi:hypothetical protein